jgi:rod shape determining protein RodA
VSVLAPVFGTRNERPKGPRLFDVALLVPALAVALVGALVVYSATRGQGEVLDRSFLTRQMLFIGLGAGLFGLLAWIDYRAWLPLVAGVFSASLGSLALVLTSLGREVNGTQGWFSVGGFSIQPGEFAKLALIATIAMMVSGARGMLSGRRLLVILVVTALPIGLILRQPDAGTALVCGAVTLTMVLVAGARWWHVLVMVLLAVVAGALVLTSGTMETYQQDRLTSFLNPDAYGQGIGWNQEQAQVAIGQGGLTGLGLFEGTQTKGAFVPEQQTDFIFTVVGEEFGFLGGVTLLGLYAVVLWRIWRAASTARDRFGRSLCVGVLSMMLFQMFQSIGMTMGLMPITGIPLPLVSYGGSSMLTTWASLGLVASVARHRDASRSGEDRSLVMR